MDIVLKDTKMFLNSSESMKSKIIETAHTNRCRV